MATNDEFGARSELQSSGGSGAIYRIQKLEADGIATVSRLPYSIRVLLEAALRQCDGFEITREDVERIAKWSPETAGKEEIPFKPARVVMQDFTGVPAVVDLAVMRDAVVDLGGDPKKVNPLIPVDLVIDHSVQVDYAGLREALARNSDDQRLGRRWLGCRRYRGRGGDVGPADLYVIARSRRF
jgi:aconitate hydratase